MLGSAKVVVKSWVAAGVPGKLVFVSSIVGLVSVPLSPAYAASKHALQSIAEAMYEEFKPFGIQVQTINPGPYLTGFNESMVEAGLRWLSDDASFVKRDAFQNGRTRCSANLKEGSIRTI